MLAAYAIKEIILKILNNSKHVSHKTLWKLYTENAHNKFNSVTLETMLDIPEYEKWYDM